MATNLDGLSDQQLDDLLRQCTETIEAVYVRLEQDSAMTDGLRQLLRAGDLLGKLNELQLADKSNAELILHAAIAVLVNSQSVRAIQAEKQARRKDRN
jgi:hypothetical protein